jgi:hypothetical protein
MRRECRGACERARNERRISGLLAMEETARARRAGAVRYFKG